MIRCELSDGEAWTGLYLSQTTIADLVGSGAAEIGKGSLEEATVFFDLFHRYRPEKAVLVAPHLDDPHRSEGDSRCHLAFEPNDQIDQGVLAAYEPLGVEPGGP